ncbi:MAG: glycosyltransferase family 39 protein, partial [Nanoarchaeota archaeon]
MERPVWWVLAVLLLCVVLGAYFRSYHLDYPSIGYHNWKENRYLTAARNFDREGFFAYGIFVPAYDLPKLRAEPSGAHSDFFPVSSIAAALMFKLFGLKLWAARLPGMLVSTLTIILMYLVVRRLFERDDIALVAAALTAINPLFIFFSHNVDQMPYGLFFVALAWCLFFRWLDNDTGYFLLLAAFAAAIGVMTKYTYVMSLLPILAVFPYTRLREWRTRWPVLAGASALVALAPLWWYYASYVLTAVYGGSAQGEGALKITPLFEPGTLAILKSFTADNYTLVGLLFAFIGLALFLLLRKRLSVLCRRFVLAYVASSALLVLLVAESIKGHSYHQFPLAPLIIILIAYLFTVVAVTVSHYIKLPYVRSGVLVLLFFVPVPVFSYAVNGIGSHTLFFSSMQAANRQWDTQFFGLDVAGEYVRTHKSAGDRIIHSSHQAFGILWHGDLKGT